MFRRNLFLIMFFVAMGLLGNGCAQIIENDTVCDSINEAEDVDLNDDVKETTNLRELIGEDAPLEIQNVGAIKIRYGNSADVSDIDHIDWNPIGVLDITDEEMISSIMQAFYSPKIVKSETEGKGFDTSLEIELYRNDCTDVHTIRINGNTAENDYMIQTFGYLYGGWWEVIDGKEYCKQIFDIYEEYLSKEETTDLEQLKKDHSLDLSNISAIETVYGYLRTFPEDEIEQMSDGAIDFETNKTVCLCEGSYTFEDSDLVNQIISIFSAVTLMENEDSGTGYERGMILEIVQNNNETSKILVKGNLFSNNYMIQFADLDEKWYGVVEGKKECSELFSMCNFN